MAAQRRNFDGADGAEDDKQYIADHLSFFLSRRTLPSPTSPPPSPLCALILQQMCSFALDSVVAIGCSSDCAKTARVREDTLSRDNHSTFWHFFPPGVSPPAAPSDNPTTWQTPPTAPSASAPPTSALPLTTTTPQIETSKPPSCRARKCNSTRIAIKCKRRMCRRDCLASGGCPFHHPDDKPTHPPLPALSGSSLKALNDIITYIDSLPGPTEAQRLARLWEEQKHSSTSTLLATTSPSPSPSPLLPSPVNGSMLPSSSTSDLVFEPCSVLLFWPTHRASVVIQVIEDCPTWPRLRLDDIPLLLTTPEHPELDRYYQCYSFAYNRWMQVSTTYVHKLSSDRPLLIRRLGVKKL
ncbi:hypothetical protein C8J57DRAFT_1554077 [Mycena rebaudengoi]|nr:hypothetical protein C8J57DRAFT_1554077 [Mycena rebaudengoi]